MKKNSFSNKDQERSQKKVFYLLYEDAVKFTFRYTNIGSNTEHYVYKGFGQLFREWKHINLADLHLIKALLKIILIKICIESEMKQEELNDALKEYAFFYNYPSEKLQLNSLSAKQIIDIVKSIPFPLRLLYNLSVIDGYTEKEIASILHIQPELIQRNIHLARQCLIHAYSYNTELERKRV